MGSSGRLCHPKGSSRKARLTRTGLRCEWTLPQRRLTMASRGESGKPTRHCRLRLALLSVLSRPVRMFPVDGGRALPPRDLSFSPSAPLVDGLLPLTFPPTSSPALRPPTLPPYSSCPTSGPCLTSNIDSPLPPTSPPLSSSALCPPTPPPFSSHLTSGTHCVLWSVRAWSSHLSPCSCPWGRLTLCVTHRGHSYRLLPGWGRVIYTIRGVPCSRPGACPVVYHGARSPPEGAADTHTHRGLYRHDSGSKSLFACCVTS